MPPPGSPHWPAALVRSESWVSSRPLRAGDDRVGRDPLVGLGPLPRRQHQALVVAGGRAATGPVAAGPAAHREPHRQHVLGPHHALGPERTLHRPPPGVQQVVRVVPVAQDRLDHLLTALEPHQDDARTGTSRRGHRTPRQRPRPGVLGLGAGTDLLPGLPGRVLAVVRRHPGAQVVVAATSRATARAIASSSGGEVPVDAVLHELPDAAAAATDDREPGGPGLQGGDAERLQPAGGDVDVGGGVPVAAAPRARPGRAVTPRPPGRAGRRTAPAGRGRGPSPSTSRCTGTAGPTRSRTRRMACSSVLGPLAAGQPHRRHEPDAVAGPADRAGPPGRPSGPRRCRWRAR